MAKTSGKIERSIIHAENLSEAEAKGIISLYQELVPDDKVRPIDIGMIVKEAFPKFEETVGEEAFYKVKSCFGLNGRPAKKLSNEVRSYIAKLRTIENAQYYIFGYKELIKQMAEKLCNAPEGMSDLVKAKLLRVFFVILADNDRFVEDYVTEKVTANGFPKCTQTSISSPVNLPNIPLGGRYTTYFSQKQALLNNQLMYRPERLFTIYDRKIRNSEGFYYDMLVIFLQRMYRECHEYQTRSMNELEEVLKFAELRYDGENKIFTSVNRCMPSVNFGEIRKLKERIHQVCAVTPLEDFCNRKSVRRKTDIFYLYVIYKMLRVYPWKEKSRKIIRSYPTMAGDKKQAYFEVYKNFEIADEAEAERWVAKFEYLAEIEEVLEQWVDVNGNRLPKPKLYNAGILSAVLNYTLKMGYTSDFTRVELDWELVDKILAIEGAEEIFLKYKREEIEPDEVRLALGMDEKFERDVLKIVSPVQSIIEFALRNGYAQSKADIDISLIENVIFPGNGEIIKKFAEGEIKDSKLRREIGFEVEFAEAYFDTSKLNIKKVEARLQEIKRKRSKEMVRESKLLIKLYSYVVKNGIGCGSNMKPVPRNKHLKPEMLEQLIM